MDKQNLFRGMALVAGTAVGCLAISLAIMAWSEPGSTPPGGNVAAPLNNSADAQTKSGPLGFSSGRTYWIDKVGESLALKTGDDIASAATKFIIGSDGHVGIGTDVPATTLDLGGTGRIGRVQDPVADQDAATKSWVEGKVATVVDALSGESSGTCKGSTMLAIKHTSATYNGNLGGLAAAQTICATAYPGFHFCEESEIRNFGRTGCLPNPLQYLGALGAFINTATDNCNNWTSALHFERGTPGNPNIGYKAGTIHNNGVWSLMTAFPYCDYTFPLACCKEF